MFYLGKPFSIGLVDHLFQPVWSRVETVEKPFMWLRHLIEVRVRTFSRSYWVSTKNGWKSVLLRNVNLINPNRLRLIPTEHDLRNKLEQTISRTYSDPMFLPSRRPKCLQCFQKAFCIYRWSLPRIGHFRVLLCLCFKTSLCAKPLIWKWVLQAVSFSCKPKSFSKERFRT